MCEGLRTLCHKYGHPPHPRRPDLSLRGVAGEPRSVTYFTFALTWTLASETAATTEPATTKSTATESATAESAGAHAPPAAIALCPRRPAAGTAKSAGVPTHATECV